LSAGLRGHGTEAGLFITSWSSLLFFFLTFAPSVA